jgi:hypothetical protein
MRQKTCIATPLLVEEYFEGAGMREVQGNTARKAVEAIGRTKGDGADGNEAGPSLADQQSRTRRLEFSKVADDTCNPHGYASAAPSGLNMAWARPCLYMRSICFDV